MSPRKKRAPRERAAKAAAPEFEVSVGDDGKVVIHAFCRPGEDPKACEERVRFLVEALGSEGRIEVTRAHRERRPRRKRA